MVEKYKLKVLKSRRSVFGANFALTAGRTLSTIDSLNKKSLTIRYQITETNTTLSVSGDLQSGWGGVSEQNR